MKKSLFIAFIMLFGISFIEAQQAKPSCSLIMCSKVEHDNGRTNLMNTFSGFNESALNSTQYFSLYLIFRGYEPKKSHTHYTKLVQVSTNTTTLETQLRSFVLDGLDYVHIHTHDWEVDFKAKGLYYIAVYVDNVEAQRTYFSVGD
jgi:hypothetical protein